MFKTLVIVFVGTLLAMFAYDLFCTHVQQVNGLNMIYECSMNRCVNFNNETYVIK